MPDENKKRNDHDLLTTLVAEFRAYMKQDVVDKQNIRGDIKELKDNYSDRITSLEQKKISFEDFMLHKHELAKEVEALQKTINDNHEKRIKYIETYKGAIVVTLALLWGAWGILLSVFIYHYI
jgi:uncharacterized protein YeeX (DUF496 family)